MTIQTAKFVSNTSLEQQLRALHFLQRYVSQTCGKNRRPKLIGRFDGFETLSLSAHQISEALRLFHKGLRCLPERVITNDKIKLQPNRDSDMMNAYKDNARRKFLDSFNSNKFRLYNHPHSIAFLKQ
jgi:hypothetical protein